MNPNLATAADIEIIERVPAAHFDAAAEGNRSIVAPNEVRINGQAVLCANGPIQIGPLSATDPVLVTLTIFARSIRIGAAPAEQVAGAADAYLQGVNDSGQDSEPAPPPSAVVGGGRIAGIAPATKE